MAESWMKVEETTPDKPEIAILARRLGVSLGDAFLNWFRLYRWAGRVTGDGFVRSVSGSDADQLSGAMPGTCDALGSAAVGWVEIRADGIMFVNWDRHNSKSAKARALDAVSKRLKRENVRPESGCEPDKTGDRARGEREGDLSLTSEWKASGSAGDRPPAPNGDHSRLRSQKYFSLREGRTLANLDDLDWSWVCSMAERAATYVPAITTDDRRQWLRYAVLAATALSEDWLIGSAEKVVNAKQTKRTKQAHFVGVLKARAADSGYDSGMFLAMLGSIEIPDDVWKSSAVETRK